MKDNNKLQMVDEEKQDFKRFLTRRTSALVLCLVMVMCMAVSSFAAETTPVTAADWQTVMDAMTSQISVATVVGVLAVVASACIGLVFMWWGVRKATRMLFAAFRKGKLSV